MRTPRSVFWFRALLFVLFATSSLSSSFAAPADKKAPPKTHRLLTLRSPSPVAWLLPVPIRGDDSPSKMTRLYAVTYEGMLFGIHSAKTRWTAKRLDKIHRLSALAPPVVAGENRIAAVGKKGSLIIIELPAGKTTLIRPSGALSRLSRPVAIDASNVAASGADGSLILFRRGADSQWIESQRIPSDEADVLRDAILTTADLDGDGSYELIVPAVPSTRYGHGVLGNSSEPTEFRAYKFERGRLRLLSSYKAEKPAVFEALGATAGDLDGDGKDEVLITQSDHAGGAAHLVLSLRNGNLVRRAKGVPIGQGFRWSHLLGAFDLPPHGQRVLAIETPHLSGFLLALRLNEDRLLEQARRPGFTTHAIGSRNLWEFAVMRRSGGVEIVLQEVGRRNLTALALGDGRWEVRWSLPLSHPVGSNLAVGDFTGDGRDDLVFARKDGQIQILHSR